MNKTRFTKAIIAACIAALCVCGLAACGNNSSSSSASSGGVAATVNGTEIPEQKVTDQIQSIRAQSGLEEEDAWGEFLASNDMTPSSVREQIIDSLVDQELVKQGAAELGVTVEDSEIDGYVNNMKANYDSDEKWNKALEQAGFTEESYRETLKQSLYSQKANEHFEESAEVSDEDMLTQARTYATYYNGAKRSSHILFGVEDKNDTAAVEAAKKQAADVRAQIEAGTLSFEDAVKQYSTDEGSKANNGDVGWDIMSSFVTEYTDALATLDAGQLSEPVQSDFGIHLIKVTEVYTAPEDTSTITSMDQIPEAFRDSIKTMAKSSKANTDFTTWLDGLKEKAEIVINDMPSGLPYDVDMSKYATSESSSTDAESSSASSSESESTSSSEASSSSESASAESASSSSSESSSSSSSSAQ